MNTKIKDFIVDFFLMFGVVLTYLIYQAVIIGIWIFLCVIIALVVSLFQGIRDGFFVGAIVFASGIILWNVLSFLDVLIKDIKKYINR